MTHLPAPMAPRPRASRVLRRAVLPTVVATLALASTAAAHDFWIIPDMFVFGSDAMIRASGRVGTRFPTGSAVQPARVADARLIGATSQTKITQLSVEGSALRLHEQAPAPGQYVIAAQVYRGPGAAANEWSIARTTYVFHVGASH